MRKIATLVVFCATAVLAAPQFTTTIVVSPGGDEAAGSSLVAALKSGSGTRLDACWTRGADRAVKLEVTDGRVTKVEAVGTFDAPEQACLERELKGRKVSSGKGALGLTLELRSRSHPDRLTGLMGKGEVPIRLLGVASGQGGLRAGPGGSVDLDERPVKPQRAEPRLSFGVTNVVGALTAQEVERVLGTRAGAFRSCFTNGAEGTVAATLELAVDGKVASVTRSETSPLLEDAVETCVASELEKCRFLVKSPGTKADVSVTSTQRPRP